MLAYIVRHGSNSYNQERTPLMLVGEIEIPGRKRIPSGDDYVRLLLDFQDENPSVTLYSNQRLSIESKTWVKKHGLDPDVLL